MSVNLNEERVKIELQKFKNIINNDNIGTINISVPTKKQSKKYITFVFTIFKNYNKFINVKNVICVFLDGEVLEQIYL